MKYKSYPYTVPINHKALQHTKIKELQVRMMKWVSWYKDEKIRNRTVDKDNGNIDFNLPLDVKKELCKQLRENYNN